MRPIQRVMLIYPPVTFAPQSMKQCHLPLGLAYLAGMIRGKVELEVLDAAAEGWEREEPAGEKLLRYGLTFPEIESRIRAFKPDMVGMSCIFSSQFRNVVEIARIVKKIDPSTLTITGGTHPTFLPEYSMARCPELDFIVRGEGEFALDELIDSLRKGGDPAHIKGLVYRDGDRVKINPDREPYPNLDDIPFPARDLFPIQRYSDIGVPMGTVFRHKPYMNLITSRGCPFHCTFCSSTNFWGNNYRTRSPENVLAEMETLYRDMGVREFKFFDDNLTTNRKRAMAIFQGMIDRGLKVTWNTPNGIHVVTLDEELLDLMKRSGCFELTLAVESGNADVLRDIIRKPTKLHHVEEASALIKKKGIATNGFFIIGFPGETKDQIRNTLDFSLKIDLDRMSFFIYNPLPGTQLFDVCVEKGYITPDQMAEDADYFEGRFDTPEWTRSELHKLRRNWFWKYNAGLLFRSPARFFKNYLPLVARPRQTWEIVKRVART